MSNSPKLIVTYHNGHLTVLLSHFCANMVEVILQWHLHRYGVAFDVMVGSSAFFSVRAVTIDEKVLFEAEGDLCSGDIVLGEVK